MWNRRGFGDRAHLSFGHAFAPFPNVTLHACKRHTLRNDVRKGSSLKDMLDHLCMLIDMCGWNMN